LVRFEKSIIFSYLGPLFWSLVLSSGTGANRRIHPVYDFVKHGCLGFPRVVRLYQEPLLDVIQSLIERFLKTWTGTGCLIASHRFLKIDKVIE
jgi:hypothetical protein